MKSSETFTQIENAIIQSKALSGNDKLFYLSLKSFRNRKSKQCFPSIKRVCERSGISKDSAYPARQKLQDMGIIQFSSERGRNKSCHYRFILEDGNLDEISTALRNLSGNKIGGNKDSENRRNKGRKIGGNKDSEIGGNKDTNQMKYNQTKITHKSVCASHEKKQPAISPEDQKTIDEIIEDKAFGELHDEAAYRCTLEKAALNGTLKPKAKIPTAEDLYGTPDVFDKPYLPRGKYINEHTGGEIVDAAYILSKWNEVAGSLKKPMEFGDWWPEHFTHVIE